MTAVTKVPIPLDQRLSAFVRGPLVGLVWLATAALCVALLRDRPVALEHRAWVPPVEYEVSTPSSGVLGVVLVRAFQEVRKGELVAQLDPRPLEARLATANAEVLSLRAQIADARELADAEQQQAESLAAQEATSDADSLRMRMEGDLLRSSFDESDLRLGVLELEVQLASDEVGADLLQAQHLRASRLAEDGTGWEAEAADLALELRQAEERNRGTAARLSGQREELLQAVERTAEIRRGFPAATGAMDLPRIPAATRALEAAIRVQELVIAELELERDALNLQAPIDGQVSALYVGEGQSLMAGRAVMLVTASAAREAVVFVDPEVASGESLVGRSVELRAGERRSLETKIASLSPKTELLPERLWPHPASPAYGLALRVPMGESGMFMPGEILRARILPSEN
ncbi:MAG TPA: HlyD family efflux transporter periplasmic adaptor subunit [Planctomycetes bacterium]|nr:HlyD family efflux transporter periplasmic adaptor subunit [Planctomycetota bacterium]